MSGYPPYTVFHCERCGVEWQYWREEGCWLCGGTPTGGIDRSVPWTASASYDAARVAREEDAA